jgi:hypothetical protein
MGYICKHPENWSPTVAYPEPELCSADHIGIACVRYVPDAVTHSAGSTGTTQLKLVPHHALLQNK